MQRQGNLGSLDWSNASNEARRLMYQAVKTRVQNGQSAKWVGTFLRVGLNNNRRYGGYLVHVGMGVIAIGILAFQTWMLFGILDERTLARIAGEELPDAPWHSIYIGLEVIKLLALASLAFLQVRFVRNKPESA